MYIHSDRSWGKEMSLLSQTEATGAECGTGSQLHLVVQRGIFKTDMFLSISHNCLQYDVKIINLFLLLLFNCDIFCITIITIWSMSCQAPFLKRSLVHTETHISASANKVKFMRNNSLDCKHILKWDLGSWPFTLTSPPERQQQQTRSMAKKQVMLCTPNVRWN